MYRHDYLESNPKTISCYINRHNDMKENNRKLLYTTLLMASALTAQAGEKPNIIFILCDDMGYGDLACYGQPYIHTPNIDRLASEGMRFTQAYAGSPVSAPSRAALMTGQHTGHTLVRGNKEFWSGRVRYGRNDEYAVTGQQPYDPNHVILPEIMKDQGYTTALFGKWAGGYEGSVSTPEKRSIDEFYGYICQYMAHLYYPNFLNRYSKQEGDTSVIREVLEQNIQHPMWGAGYGRRQQYSADMIHQHAMQWLDRQTGTQPFCAFLTYTLPHAELVQPDDSIVNGYIDQFKNDHDFCGADRYNSVAHVHAQFAAMITRLDTYVGQIMKKLHEKGLDDNTIVIFTSDNGPHEEGGADPTFFGRDGKLRGLKRSCLEGGIRIPFIVRWPGHVKAGTVNSHQLAFWDVMPTFCDILGIKNYTRKYACRSPRTYEGIPQAKKEYWDGISFLPTLLGKDKQQKQHDYLYWELNESGQIGVRQGDWKLVVDHGKCHLYNLATDIHEDHDLADSQPEQLRHMVQLVHQAHVDDPLFPITLPQ